MPVIGTFPYFANSVALESHPSGSSFPRKMLLLLRDPLRAIPLDKMLLTVQLRPDCQEENPTLLRYCATDEDGVGRKAFWFRVTRASVCAVCLNCFSSHLLTFANFQSSVECCGQHFLSCFYILFDWCSDALQLDQLSQGNVSIPRQTFIFLEGFQSNQETIEFHKSLPWFWKAFARQSVNSHKTQVLTKSDKKSRTKNLP